MDVAAPNGGFGAPLPGTLQRCRIGGNAADRLRCTDSLPPAPPATFSVAELFR